MHLDHHRCLPFAAPSQSHHNTLPVRLCGHWFHVCVCVGGGGGVRACVWVRACVRACVGACVGVCVRVSACVRG